MKKAIIALLVVVLLVSCVAFTACGSEGPASSESIASLKDEINALKDKYDSLSVANGKTNNNLADLAVENDKLKDQLDANSQVFDKISALEKQIADLESLSDIADIDIIELSNQIIELKQQIVELETQIEYQYKDTVKIRQNEIEDFVMNMPSAEKFASQNYGKVFEITGVLDLSYSVSDVYASKYANYYYLNIYNFMLTYYVRIMTRSFISYDTYSRDYSPYVNKTVTVRCVVDPITVEFVNANIL